MASEETREKIGREFGGTASDYDRIVEAARAGLRESAPKWRDIPDSEIPPGGFEVEWSHEFWINGKRVG